MQIDGSLARNIDFEVANFEAHEKTRRKTSILSLQSLKYEEVSHETLVLSFQHVSSRFSGFLVASVFMGEAAKPLIFECFQVLGRYTLSRLVLSKVDSKWCALWEVHDKLLFLAMLISHVLSHMGFGSKWDVYRHVS